ncbi:MAG TPA: CBS domain-containing protein [Candidatus Saccharimonadales bacterium]|nr:CBS domain-containing protein [Candidatus Saccharimonadales bacterium]
MNQNAAEELLSLYNEVDHFLRKEYKQDKFADHSFLIQEVSAKNPVVARNQQLMRAVAQIRNSLVHNPIPSVAQPIVEPHLGLVKAYRNIHNALMKPLTALSIAVPAGQLYTTTPDANLAEVMKVMNDNIFTHVPVIENDKMVGVFSENAILSYLAENGESIITKDMKIRDMEKFLPLSAHNGESFEFVARGATLSEVYEIFNDAIQVRRRIGMIFITHNGKADEKLLGIITAWDLASPDFRL